MSKTVQWKRGNTAVNNTYVGAQGEITVNTDDYSLIVHDGIKQGGYPVLSNVALVTGNLRIVDQTISGTTVNGNIVLNPLGTGGIIANGFITTSQLSALSGIIGGVNLTSSLSGSLISSAINGTSANLRITANNSQIGLNISGATGRVAINSQVDDSLTGPQLSINGRTYSTEFLAKGNNIRGYQFTTPGGETGLSHVYQDDINGNVGVLRIRNDSVMVAKFYNNNTTTLSGNLVIATTEYGRTSFPDAFIQISADVDNSSQVVSQNINSGPLASTDFVATADNGDNESFYVDLGIASSNFEPLPGYGIIVRPNDAYLFAVGSNIAGPGGIGVTNLILGSTNGTIKFFSGAPDDAFQITEITPDGFMPGANVTYNLGSQDRQWKDLWVSNSTIYFNSIPLSIGANNDLRVNNVPLVSFVDGALLVSNNVVTLSNTSVVTVGNAATGSEGALWYNIDDGRLYVDVNIGGNLTWVDANPAGLPANTGNITFANTIISTDGTIDPNIYINTGNLFNFTQSGDFHIPYNNPTTAGNIVFDGGGSRVWEDANRGLNLDPWNGVVSMVGGDYTIGTLPYAPAAGFIANVTNYTYQDFYVLSANATGPTAAVSIGSNGVSMLTFGTSVTMDTGGNFVPYGNVSQDLGSIGAQWNTVHSGNVKVSSGLTFGDSSRQTTAYMVVAAPSASVGQSGDRAGMVAFDNGYFYYCKTDYVDGMSNIWVRVGWTETSWP